MTNILTATVTIKTTRPILWHKFGPDALPLEKQEKSGVAGNDPTEWQKTVLYDKETGQLYLEPSYIFGSFRDAAKHTKRGRSSIMRFVAATLQVSDGRIYLDRWIPGYNGHLPDELPTDDQELVYLDVRGVVNPNTRSRNVRYRVACAPGATMTFEILWDCTIVSREEMQAVAIDAGRLVGLADGRSIGMGRFEIVSFDIDE